METKSFEILKSLRQAFDYKIYLHAREFLISRLYIYIYIQFIHLLLYKLETNGIAKYGVTNSNLNVCRSRSQKSFPLNHFQPSDAM
jgi:hypothetical protein